MSHHKNKILTLLGAFSIPLVALPLIVCEIANRRTYAFYLLAFMMGLWAIWFVPTGDLYRHTLLYYQLKEYDWMQFSDFLKIRPDCLFYILLYLFGKGNLHFEWIRFLSVVGGYTFYLWIFFDYIKKAPVLYRKTYLFVFALFFFYIPFIELAGGIRFAFSTALLAFSTYILYTRKRRIAYLWGCVACLIHFGQIPIFLLICMLQNRRRLKFKYCFLLLSMLFMIGSQTIFEQLIDLLPISEIYRRIIVSYTEEYSVQQHATIYTRLYTMFSQLPTILSLVYLVFTRRQSNFVTLSVAIFLLYSLLFAFPIGNRYATFFQFTVLMAYIHSDFEQKSKSWYGISILGVFLMVFILKFYSLRQIVPSNRSLSFLFSPVSVTFFQHDSLPLILQNVDEEGSLLKKF